MRDLWFLRFSPADVPDVVDCDGSCGRNDGGGGGSCFLCSGLCCPDDLLEAVIETHDDDPLLEDLSEAADVLPSGHGQGKQHEPPLPAGRHGRGKSDKALRIIMGWDRSVPSDGETLLPERQTESPPPPSPRLVVPKRKRDRTERRRREWSLGTPPHASAALSGSPSGGSDDSGRGSSAGGGGGARLQRPPPVPRPRNRQANRVCTHCDETETPQWRAGPYGPGTLCNACGLRFKQGKLVPGYRPSSSPGFRSDLHSNRYRKAAKLSADEATEGSQRQQHVLVSPAGGGATPW